MWPSPILWCRSLKAPRTSIESFACTSRSRSGSADLDDPVDGRGRAAGLVERRPGREDVAGVQADPGLGVVVEGGEVRREVLDARAQRPALPGGRLEQQPRRGVAGDRVEQRQQPLADLPHRRRVPFTRILSVPGSTYEPVCTTTPSAPISAARLRLCATEATDLSYVDAVGEPRLTRYGAWMNTRVPRSAVSRAERSSSAGLPAECAHPRGLPTKTWNVSQPSSSAFASAPATSPLPTRTWVPIGLRRAGSAVTQRP